MSIAVAIWVIILGPSVFTYAVLMLEVVKKSEEFCYFLCLRIVFKIKELAFYVLDARQTFYATHLADADMPVSGVIVAHQRLL